MENKTRIKLIINPNSGKGKAGELAEKIVNIEYLKEHFG